MALINCPECGTQVSSKADKCPNCAYPLKENTNVKSEGCFLQTLNFGCMLIAVVVIFVIVLVVLATLTQ